MLLTDIIDCIYVFWGNTIVITTSTILSILIFSGVILILVILLNFAESKLLPQEEVSIKINGDDDKSIQIRPGVRYYLHWRVRVFFFHPLVEEEGHVRFANVRSIQVEEKFCLQRLVILKKRSQRKLAFSLSSKDKRKYGYQCS
ncbi:MAG: hypothetical protein CM1200mP1_04710 [Candidatus Neomarinimicrobiota bacterium]|nr:MAG: hypothetical protein CM1200mP1_04710 [Candidatus Neomarinimicrobiota bacterium]